MRSGERVEHIYELGQQPFGGTLGHVVNPIGVTGSDFSVTATNSITPGAEGPPMGARAHQGCGGPTNVGRSKRLCNLGEPWVTSVGRACNPKMFCLCHQAIWLEEGLWMCQKASGELSGSLSSPLGAVRIQHKGAA